MVNNIKIIVVLGVFAGVLVSPKALRSGEATEVILIDDTSRAINEARAETRGALMRALDKVPRLRNDVRRAELVDVITAAAERHGVDPFLVLSVIAIESEFNIGARSNRNALGFMQLRHPTAFEQSAKMGRPIGELGLFDSETNIELGVAYLRACRDRLGSWPMALAAYNAGPAKVRRAVKAHGQIPASMRVYERRIAKRYLDMTRAAGLTPATTPLAHGPARARDAI